MARRHVAPDLSLHGESAPWAGAVAAARAEGVLNKNAVGPSEPADRPEKRFGELSAQAARPGVGRINRFWSDVRDARYGPVISQGDVRLY